MTQAANIEIDSIWAILLERACEAKDIKQMLFNIGSSGGGSQANSSVLAVPSNTNFAGTEAAAAVEDQAEDKPEESDEDMGFGLFD